MSETVIKLRRGVLGVRETRSQGGYCATCKRSVPMEIPAATRPSIAISGRPRHSLSGFLLELRDEHLRPALEINILKLCLPVGGRRSGA
jgi:hypothetical protein